MILHIDGNINRYYVQTLCMVFFPGATFGENETISEGVPEVSVSVFNESSLISFIFEKSRPRHLIFASAKVHLKRKSFWGEISGE